MRDVGLFSRLYIVCQTREGDLDELFSHENQACPPALSEGGRLRFGAKSDLLACFEDLSHVQVDASVATDIILDGVDIVHMLKPADSKYFDEYARHSFIPFIFEKLQSATHVDIAWDTYKEDSLKSTARIERGKGVRRCVEGQLPYQKIGQASFALTPIKQSSSDSCRKLSWSGLTWKTSS